MSSQEEKNNNNQKAQSKKNPIDEESKDEEPEPEQELTLEQKYKKLEEEKTTLQKQIQQQSENESKKRKREQEQEELDKQMVQMKRHSEELAKLGTLMGKNDLKMDDVKDIIIEQARKKQKKISAIKDKAINYVVDSYKVSGMEQDNDLIDHLKNSESNPNEAYKILKMVTAASTANNIRMSQKEEELQQEKIKREQYEKQYKEQQQKMSEMEKMFKREQGVQKHQQDLQQQKNNSAPIRQTPSSKRPVEKTNPGFNSVSNQGEVLPGDQNYIAPPSDFSFVTEKSDGGAI